MGLYEIVTGWYGESFERCYVWASSRERALEIFQTKHTSREAKEMTLVCMADDPEFITELCDIGFGDIVKSFK